MKRVDLKIIGLTHSISSSQNYAIILGEVEGSRRLPIVIGGFEAQAIAVALEQITPGRPLTHDLIVNILLALDATLEEVFISGLQEGVFHARLICEKNGRTIEIDSRTSDALALAVRFACPIYTTDAIMEEAAIIMEGSQLGEHESDDDDDDDELESLPLRTSSSLSDMSMEELQEALEEALSEEDYKKAAQIRDELNKR